MKIDYFAVTFSFVCTFGVCCALDITVHHPVAWIGNLLVSALSAVICFAISAKH